MCRPYSLRGATTGSTREAADLVRCMAGEGGAPMAEGGGPVAVEDVYLLQGLDVLGDEGKRHDQQVGNFLVD